MRKLAKVVEIDGIEAIANADAIELATVGGWKVVVKKGEYQSGDKAIYLEIDSFLPEGNPLWQFLVDKSSRIYDGVKGHVLKSVKLRGKVSQGLLLPLTEDTAVGTDLTEALGISKYEPSIPANLAGEAEGLFPRSIPKTDQERVQNLSSQWDILRGNLYEVTEKVEGCSMTVYLIDGKFGVCSRNLDLKENPDNTLWKVAIAQQLQFKLGQVATAISSSNVAFQGELIGEGIQGNYYGIKGHAFYLFDIYDVDRQVYLMPDLVRGLCEQYLVAHCPIIKRVANISAQSIESLLEWADEKSILNPQKNREGLVFKSADGDRCSFKAISNKFLLGQK